MYELVVYYVLPNIAMFGGLYLLGKGIETAVWNVIENHEKFFS